MNSSPAILIADDCDNDVSLMKRAFELADFPYPLLSVNDGTQVLAFLEGRGEYSDRRLFPLPAVLLLDLNMRRMSGFEVLDWVRNHSSFKGLPVYVLSASSRESEVRRARDGGANAYFVKPSNLTGLVELAKCLKSWLSSNLCPLIDSH